MVTHYPLILLTFSFCALSGCAKHEVCPPQIDLPIGYKDKQGRDLLDATTPSHYLKKDIKRYAYVKHKKTQLPDSIDILHIDTYKIDFVMSNDTMLLQLSPQITDTVICMKNSCPVIKKAWYNGKLVFDQDANLLNVVINK